MSFIDIAADIKQGFDFSKDKQTTVGFLSSLKISTVDFEKDFPLYDPVEDADVNVVGVLQYASWSTNKTDEIDLSFQISLKNRKAIRQALMAALTSSHVEFEFRVCEYDSSPDQKKYYVSFSTGDEMLHGALRDEGGGTLRIDCADTPGSEVQQPENFTLNISVVPDQKDQNVHVAVGVGANMVKQWGVKA